MSAPQAWSQAADGPAADDVLQSPQPAPQQEQPSVELTQQAGIWMLRGLTVEDIQFDGVTLPQQEELLQQLPVQKGQKLDPAALQETVRRLYATGLYRNIELRGVQHGQQVTLVFAGISRYFVGRIDILGVRNDRLTSILEYATQLQPGTPFQESQIQTAVDGIKQTLQQNGYYAPNVTPERKPDEAGKQIDLRFTVDIGPQARVGQVGVDGDSGQGVDEFKKTAKLKTGKTKVTRDTVSNAFTRLRSKYQKKDRLEAKISLEDSTYAADRKQLDYKFNAVQGPLVNVTSEGDKFSKKLLKKLVPVYEEGAVDNDLVNEGAFNIRESLEQKGYFDAEVTVARTGEGTAQENVVYTILNNNKHKVTSIDITGNQYFSTDLLKERMQVVKADAYRRSGRYSQQLLAADVASIQGLYRANGFADAKVLPDTKDIENKGKIAQIQITLKVEEGQQQKFGEVKLTGVSEARQQELRGLMNAQQGQPYSLITLSGDRDAVLGYYLSHGFDQARIEVHQAKATDDGVVNVSLDVTEGEQVFVNQVLISGVVKTRPYIVQRQIKIHPNDPLDQSALLDTQRNLYNLALFGEVNTAVQNPDGNATRKNVLVQLKEARRWDVTYGAGFEAQTGTPQTNCNAQLSLNPGAGCSQNGKTGVSPRVSVDVTRINFRGRDQSLTLHGTYGLLEQIISATFNLPHVHNWQNVDAAVLGGYSNVRNVSTFAAKTLQGSLKVTQRLNRADTLLYDFTYRRVSVDQSSLQITANLIPLLSQPVRVGGPGITFLHDTRQPSPLDAMKGVYLSVQNFFSYHTFGSDVDFNRTDITNSTYYAFGKKGRYVFARSTRFGFIATFSSNPQVTSNSSCKGREHVDPSCDPIPLPERLYVGGATSHRGFGINAAGPRDLTTGYPVGGTGALVNSFEFRMPGPVLPIVNDNLQVVIFHDMGNAFLNVSDIWKSVARFKQPNEKTCRIYTGVTEGTCDFSYFSHAVGLGARYKTPVGPVRVDFSYNLNPPIYPVVNDYSLPYPKVNGYQGSGGRFNFFFSIGQTF